MNTFVQLRKILIIGMVVGAVINQTCAPLAYADGDESGGIVGALQNLTRQFITTAIAIAALLLAIGIVTNFIGGQFLVTVGQPYGLSGTWVKIAGVVICFVGAALTITIANTIIDAVNAHISTGDIHIPTGG